MIIQKTQSQTKFGMALHLPDSITSHNERNLLKRGLAKTALNNDVFVGLSKKIVGISFWPFKVKFEPVYLINVVKQSDDSKDKYSSAFVLPKKEASLATLDCNASYHSFLAGLKKTTKELDSAFAYFAQRRRAKKVDEFIDRIKKAVLG